MFLDRYLLIFHIQTTGRTPGNMTDISIVPQELFQDEDEIYFDEDDVLQLQCIAEVENINGFPSKVYIYIYIIYKYTFHLNSQLAKITCKKHTLSASLRK